MLTKEFINLDYKDINTNMSEDDIELMKNILRLENE